MRAFGEKEFDRVWSKFFTEAEREWFKVEAIQDYSAVDNSPSLQAWKSGQKTKSLELIRRDFARPDEPWLKRLRQSPARKIRYHVVVKPYTKYIEWETEVYKLVNIPLGGEEVFLVPKEKVPNLKVPEFQIFDGMRVLRLYQDSKDGRFIKGDVYDEQDDISRFIRLRGKLAEYAEPIKLDS